MSTLVSIPMSMLTLLPNMKSQEVCVAVGVVDIDVELPDNDMELDSQLKPMVRSFHSSLSPNSVRFQSAVNCTKRHNASKCIEVRQNHALVEQGKRMR